MKGGWQFFRRSSLYWKSWLRNGRTFSMYPTTTAVMTALILIDSHYDTNFFRFNEPIRRWIAPVMYAKGEMDEIPIEMACKTIIEKDYYRLKSWLESGALDPNKKTVFGYGLLHVAAIHGLRDYVNLLLEHGADVNLQDDFSMGQLESSGSKFGSPGSEREMIAARMRDFAGLLRPIAKLSGSTALHYAVLADHLEIVKILVDHGADPSPRNKLGHTPLDYINQETSHSITMRTILLESEKKFEEIRKKKERELRRKFPLEQKLKEHVVGQVAAINALASAVRRKENGWHDENRPLVFLFLGSSGIGKTELAKRLAQYIHKKDSTGFIRVDLSEFQDKHEVSKLIGSPPGYIGYDEGGQLTKKLADCKYHDESVFDEPSSSWTLGPNAVVLLDEVEKAHPDVLMVMLQLFDEGRLTDGQGRTVDCRDAIFIMTSNLAQDIIAEQSTYLRSAQLSIDPKEISRNEGNVIVSNHGEKSLSRQFINDYIYPILRGHFKRDEFLGRITEIMYFLPFTDRELKEIVSKELESWANKALKRHHIRLTWTDDVINRIKLNYDAQYGVRSIHHEIERSIVNRIAQAHEMDEITEGSQVHVFCDSNEIRLGITKPKDAHKKKSPLSFLGYE